MLSTLLRRSTLCFAFVSIALTARLAHADYLFTSYTGETISGNANATVGSEFVVGLSDILVTQLGYYDEIAIGGIGNVQSHEVGIWQVGGGNPLMGSGTVAAGAVDPLIGDYRYADVPDFILSAGTTYRIGAQIGNAIDYSPTGGVLTLGAGVSVIGAEVSGVVAYPNIVYPANPGPTIRAAANMEFTVVPEPTTVSLLAVFGISLLRFRRR